MTKPPPKRSGLYLLSLQLRDARIPFDPINMVDPAVAVKVSATPYDPAANSANMHSQQSPQHSPQPPESPHRA